jgi:methyl-accepting chemotaxis protein
VSSSISGVNEAAGAAGNAAVQVLAAARQLTAQSDTLRNHVDRFMAGIRAA